jgi:hypothetical protein
MKTERIRVSRELLGHFEEGKRFLWQTLTGDETWAHHHVP